MPSSISSRGLATPAARTLFLETTFLVGVDHEGRVPVQRVNELPVVSLFSSYDDLPGILPRGCVLYEKRLGHILLSELPAESFLYVHPARTLISVGALLAPSVALVEAAADESGTELRKAFSDAVVYCEAGEGQVFLARQDGAIAVFSTLRALRHGLGDTRWFAAVGADLLQRLPDGCTFVLDPRSPHEATIRGGGFA
jgi:hypothetical protein